MRKTVFIYYQCGNERIRASGTLERIIFDEIVRASAVLVREDTNRGGITWILLPQNHEDTKRSFFCFFCFRDSVVVRGSFFQKILNGFFGQTGEVAEVGYAYILVLLFAGSLFYFLQEPPPGAFTLAGDALYIFWIDALTILRSKKNGKERTFQQRYTFIIAQK